MLNLDTPTLEDNALYYESKVLFDKHTPTRQTIDRTPVLKGTTITDEIIAKQEEKIEVSQAFDEMDYNFLEYEQFINDRYNLPINKAKCILKIEFEKPELDIVYELNDYQKLLSKPLFVSTTIVDLMNNKECGACKITNQIVDENGKEIDSALNFEYDIHNTKEAVNARNILYSISLNNMYSAQKAAFAENIKSNLSGLEVITKACDLAIPKANKTAENIVEDLKTLRTIKDEEKLFFENQFLESTISEIEDDAEKTKDAEK